MFAVINICKKIETKQRGVAPSVLPTAQELLTDVGVQSPALSWPSYICLALLSQAYVETAPLWERRDAWMLICIPGLGESHHLQPFSVALEKKKKARGANITSCLQQSLQCTSAWFPRNNNVTWTDSKIIRIRVEAGGGWAHPGWPSS